MRVLILTILNLLLLTETGFSASEVIQLFAGSASKPATAEAVKVFEERTGISVEVAYGGSGFLLSQMKLSRKGDLYFPGSSDFMEIAKREDVVFPDSEKRVVYLVPALNVQKGNPRQIRSLRDLSKEGLRLAIARPESVCVGLYAVEILEKNLTSAEREAVRKNLVNYTESCEKTATVISMKAVDAVLGWEVFQYWDPERIETILLRPEEIPRIGYIPIAVSRFAKNKALVERFIRFLESPPGKAIFQKHHYLMNLQEARALATPQTPVGGEYALPESWKRKR
jgi:molybdate transport system substrate-binding protein